MIFTATPQQHSTAQTLDNLPGQGRTINQYDPRYNPGANPPKHTPLDAPTIAPGPRNTSVIPVQDYSLFFIREPDANADEVYMRMALPLNVEGCLDITPPTLQKIEQAPPYLRIFINPPIIRPNHKKAPDQGCQASTQEAYLDVILNRKNIRSKNIDTLTIREGTAADEFKIHISKNKILLTGSPATFVPRILPGKTNPLEYWFYPENTVILNTLDTKDASPEETYDAIKKLANDNNMISLETAIPRYRQLYDSKNRFFFVDKSNTWPQKINENASTLLGKIELQKQRTGLNGPFTYTSNHNVFVSKPSYFD